MILVQFRNMTLIHLVEYIKYQFHLWQMSSANGMKQSFDQFKYYQGSIVKLSTVKDLGLSANQAPSMTGNYDFMVTGTLSNPDVQSLNALVPGKK